MMMATEQIKTDNTNEFNAPQFTREYLDSFERKVIDNTATLDDYKSFDLNIKSLGLSRILFDELKRYGIFNFEQLVFERNKKSTDKDTFSEVGIVSTFKGLINALRSIT